MSEYSEISVTATTIELIQLIASINDTLVMSTIEQPHQALITSMTQVNNLSIKIKAPGTDQTITITFKVRNQVSQADKHLDLRKTSTDHDEETWL